jgi:hypothetical protein
VADQEVLDYIRRHRDRYTRDALRATLLAAGHPPDAVDEAFRAVDAEPVVNLRPRAVQIVLVGYVIVWLGFSLFIGLSGLAIILALYFGVGLLVSLVVLSLWPRLDRVRADRAVNALAAALVIPFAILFGLLGFCIWAAGGLSSI